MVRICQQNKASVLEKAKFGQIDAAAMSSSNFVDEIILAMHQKEILQCLENSIEDKRADNTTIPFRLIWALSIAAKMKTRTSLTDIPFAITDHKTLGELGYSMYDSSGDLGRGLMRESSLRFLLGKYQPSDWINYYSSTVQKHIAPKLNLSPSIHILDCTKLEVNLSNANYEDSGIGTDKDGNAARGYKLATLRGIVSDTGILEDIRFGAINVHDLALAK